MNLSRRGFLAGAIGALSTRILAAPAKLQPPRFWMKVGESGWTGVPTEPALAFQFFAVRNDGVYFCSTAKINLVELDREGVTDIRPIQADHKVQARIILDGFLDPRCECSPGVYCAHHNFMAPTRYDDSEDPDGEESFSESAIA